MAETKPKAPEKRPDDLGTDADDEPKLGDVIKALDTLTAGLTEQQKAQNEFYQNLIGHLGVGNPPTNKEVTTARGSEEEEEETETKTDLYTKEELEALTYDHIVGADEDEKKKSTTPWRLSHQGSNVLWPFLNLFAQSGRRVSFNRHGIHAPHSSTWERGSTSLSSHQPEPSRLDRSRIVL